MALKPAVLDDLTWEQLVEAARHRIAAESKGEWSLHAPVDPGVTILELYAWLLEQRVYWLDQVPDSLVHAAAHLLGFKIKKSISASTALTFESHPFREISKDTPMMLEGSQAQNQAPIVFSTDFSITLLPFPKVSIRNQNGRGFKKNKTFNPVHIYVGKEEKTSDLMDSDRTIELLPQNSSQSTKIVLWLTQPIPDPPAAAPISLLFDLKTPLKILPQWSPESIDVPIATPVTWHYEKETGGQKIRTPFAKDAIKDGTGHFRRSGIVRLTIPSGWAPHDQVTNQGNLIPYAIWIHADSSAYTSPPVVRQIVPNTAMASHRRSLPEPREEYVDWLPLPGQKLALPPTQRPVLEKSVQLQLRERNNKWYPWKPTTHLAFHSPDDRVFIVDREKHVLIFGDGLTGRQTVPQLNSTTEAEKAAPNMKLKFDIGGGEHGNIAAGRIWVQYDNEIGAPVSVTPLQADNPVSSVGGKDPETIEDLRSRIATELKKPTRAVTRDDYINLVRNLKGVAFSRVYPAIGYHPEQPCVPVLGATTLFVVPEAPRNTDNNGRFNGQLVANPTPDAGALQFLYDYLNEKRLLTSELFICDPRYRAVNLRVEIATDHNNHGELKSKIEDNLRRYLDPLIGGDDDKGWPFGGPLRPSAFVRRTQQVLGDTGHVISVLIGLDEAAPHEDCNDVEIAPHELVFAGQISIHVSQTRISKGTLE
jgi:predicted phage baseplate assembly protein